MKSIKFMVILVSIALGMILTACEEDNNTGNSDELVGTWELQYVEIGTLKTSNSTIREVLNDYFDDLTEDFEEGDVIKFNEDGSGRFWGATIEYTVKKNTLIVVDREDYELEFTYKISGGKLILTLDTRELLIEQLSGELSKDELNVFKEAVEAFTIEFTYTAG